MCSVPVYRAISAMYLCTDTRNVPCSGVQSQEMCSVSVYRATSTMYLCIDTRNVPCPCVQSPVQCTCVQILEMCHVPVYRATTNVQHTEYRCYSAFACAMYLCTEPLYVHSVPVNRTTGCAQHLCT